MFFWKKKPRQTVKIVQAKYDAAQTTLDNMRHWAMADALSADAGMTPDIRRTLRNRSRYEVANNSYAKGMILSIAGDCIGTGPRLQLAGPGEMNNAIEDEFADWCKAIDLPGKLRTMRMARATDGEAFAALIHNPKVDHPVKLDLQLVEADRVTSCDILFQNLPDVVDGIEYDRRGNPTLYYVLKNHPGDLSYTFNHYDRVAASVMLHWYRPDRPGQHRGIPEITPALPLFAQLRRYTLAVLAAAETAADFAAVLYTSSPADGEAAEVKPLESIPLSKRMATTLPEGWQLGQVKAEHPSTTYGEFKREILCEIGRCLLVPSNVITGDSSRHNYASGRLDHQTYFKTVRIDQSSCEQVVMNPVFDSWYAEFRLISPKIRRQEPLQTAANTDFLYAGSASYLSARPATHSAVKERTWMWDGSEHVDPLKEAKAQETRLGSLTTTLASEYAKQGKDWEIELRQAAKERQLKKDLGLLVDESSPNNNPQENDDEETEEGDE